MGRPLLPLDCKRTGPNLESGDKEKMDASACKVLQKLTSSQTSVTSILGLLYKQEVKTSFWYVYAGGSKGGCIFCCLCVCANAVTSLTVPTALCVLDHTCVFPECTQWRLVPLVCQQQICACVNLKM